MIRAVREYTNSAVSIIAYSMGSPIARKVCWPKYNFPDYRNQILVVLLGSLNKWYERTNASQFWPVKSLQWTLIWWPLLIHFSYCITHSNTGRRWPAAMLLSYTLTMSSGMLHVQQVKLSEVHSDFQRITVVHIRVQALQFSCCNFCKLLRYRNVFFRWDGGFEQVSKHMNQHPA